MKRADIFLTERVTLLPHKRAISPHGKIAHQLSICYYKDRVINPIECGKMNRNARLLLIGLSFTLVLSLSLSPAYAAKPPETPKGWSGTQLALPLGNVTRFSQDSIRVEIEFKSGAKIVIEYGYPNAVIHIYDAWMQVVRGYNFGNIHVDSEKITEETITIPMSELVGKSSINIYDYQHYGSFEWYSRVVKVGTGTFWKSDGAPRGGSLEAALGLTEVKGIYRVARWADMTIPGFPTVKVPAVLNHAGLYSFQPNP